MINTSIRTKLGILQMVLFVLCLNILSVEAKKKSTLPTRPAPTQTAIDLVNRANDLYSQNEFAKAIIIYKKAEDRGADPSICAFNIGNCYFRLNQFSSAAASFQKAVRLSNGTYVSAIMNQAAVLFRLEQYPDAIAAYRRGLKLDPDNLGGWLYLADAYARTKDYVGSQQALEKARALDPEDVSIIYQLSEVHVALKEFDDAIALIREAVTKKPNEVDFLFYIGDLYRQKGNLEEAANAYREGLARKDTDVDAMYKLADVLTESKKPYLAMDVLQKALTVKPSFSDAAVFLGNLAFDAKWWDRAESAYFQALKNGNKEGMEGLRNLAYEYHQKGDKKQAVKILTEALKIRKDVEAEGELKGYVESEG